MSPPLSVNEFVRWHQLPGYWRDPYVPGCTTMQEVWRRCSPGILMRIAVVPDVLNSNQVYSACLTFLLANGLNDLVTSGRAPDAVHQAVEVIKAAIDDGGPQLLSLCDADSGNKKIAEELEQFGLLLKQQYDKDYNVRRDLTGLADAMRRAEYEYLSVAGLINVLRWHWSNLFALAPTVVGRNLPRSEAFIEAFRLQTPSFNRPVELRYPEPRGDPSKGELREEQLMARAATLGELRPLDIHEREWCLREIANTEGYERYHWEDRTDSQLARGVLAAWRDQREEQLVACVAPDPPPASPEEETRKTTIS